MASQWIISAPHLTVAVHPIGTRPMEAGNRVLTVVAFIVMENKGEIGTDSDLRTCCVKANQADDQPGKPFEVTHGSALIEADRRAMQGCNVMERNCQVVEIEAIDGDRREPS